MESGLSLWRMPWVLGFRCWMRWRLLFRSWEHLLCLVVVCRWMLLWTIVSFWLEELCVGFLFPWSLEGCAATVGRRRRQSEKKTGQPSHTG